jgi:hypothetical protein
LTACSGTNEIALYNKYYEGYLKVASLRGMKKGNYTVDFANKSDKFAFGGGDGVLYVMNYKIGA